MMFVAFLAGATLGALIVNRLRRPAPDTRDLYEAAFREYTRQR